MAEVHLPNCKKKAAVRHDSSVIDLSAYIHRLCGLEGAIQGVRKKNLPEGVKAELKEFYNSWKQEKR
jgi:hypothetical protein